MKMLTGLGYLVEEHGFSLHAAVRTAAHQRKAIEPLCRYITHPRSLTNGWFLERPMTAGGRMRL